MNILILTYWSYNDALIQTYTLPYVRIIQRIVPNESKIFFVTFENRRYALSKDKIMKTRKQLANENISWISFPYSPLGILAIFKNIFAFTQLLLLCISKKINYIHAWCTPAGSIGYILSKLTGIPLIIDSYEPHAESMIENNTWKKNSLAFKTLFFFEKLLSKHALATIATSQEMVHYSKEKYNTDLKNFFTKPACVDFNLFTISNHTINKTHKKIICVYAGKLGGIYLEQEVFDFFKTASDYWGSKFNVLLLTDTSKSKITSYAKQSGLDEKIITVKFVEHKEIPKYLALADFAINPVKPVPTKKYCTSIKDGEYWAMGLPVVIPENISDDSDIIQKNNIGAVLPNLNNQEYLVAVKKIDHLLRPENIEVTRETIISISKQYRSMDIAEKIYNSIYYKI